MARIPVYDAPRVQERGLPNAFQQGTNNVRAFTGGAEQLGELGQGIQRAAAQFDQVAERLQVAEVNKTDAAITSGWLKWEAENRPKFVGENAANFQAEADKWWQETKNTYRQNVNPVTLERLNQTLGQRYDRAMAGVISYQNDQVDRHTVSTIESRINSDVEWGVATGDTEAAALRVRETAEQLAMLRRWAPQQKDEYIRGKLDAMHGARVISLVRDDANAATAYLDDAIARGELSAVRSAQLRETVQAAGEEQEGQRLARSVADLPYAERLKAASEQENPNVRKAMEATIEADQRVLERIKKDEVGKVVGNLQTSMYSTGRVPSAADLEQLRQLDPEAAGAMAREIAAFRKASAEAARGREIKTDPTLWLDLNDRIRAGENVNLREYVDRLSPSDVQKFATLQQDMRKPGTQDTLFTPAQRVDNALLDLGIDKKKKPEQAVRFSKAVDDVIRRTSEAKGRKLTPDEEQAAIDSVIKDTVYVKETWGSSDPTPISLVDPEDLSSAYVTVPVLDAQGQPKLNASGGDLTKRMPLASIPLSFRENWVLGYFQQNRVMPSEAEVARAYNRFLHQGGK